MGFLRNVTLWAMKPFKTDSTAFSVDRGRSISVGFRKFSELICYQVVSWSTTVSGVLFCQNLQWLSGAEAPEASKLSGWGLFFSPMNWADCDLISQPLLAALVLFFFFWFLTLHYLLCAAVFICDSRLDSHAVFMPSSLFFFVVFFSSHPTKEGR